MSALACPSGCMTPLCPPWRDESRSQQKFIDTWCGIGYPRDEPMTTDEAVLDAAQSPRHDRLHEQEAADPSWVCDDFGQRPRLPQIWPPFPASYLSMGSQGPDRGATGDPRRRTPLDLGYRRRTARVIAHLSGRATAVIICFSHGPSVARALPTGESESMKERGSPVRPTHRGCQVHHDPGPPPELQPPSPELPEETRDGLRASDMGRHPRDGRAAERSEWRQLAWLHFLLGRPHDP
jgi:hypothetical protein